MLCSIFKRRGIKPKLILTIFLTLLFIWFQYSEKSSRPVLNERKISHIDDLSVKTINSPNKSQTLEEKIKQLNDEQSINNFYFIRQILKNEEIESSKLLNQTNMKYPYPTPKFMVILIQVHSRLNYLKELINSLRETRNINETLVIFSHDIFDQDINKLIESIDFCAVCV